MNPFQLAGKFLNSPFGKAAVSQGMKAAVSQGMAASSNDPLNKGAANLFGLPYVSIPALGVMTLNAGAVAPGTLEDARHMGLLR